MVLCLEGDGTEKALQDEASARIATMIEVKDCFAMVQKISRGVDLFVCSVGEKGGNRKCESLTSNLMIIRESCHRCRLSAGNVTYAVFVHEFNGSRSTPGLRPLEFYG